MISTGHWSSHAGWHQMKLAMGVHRYRSGIGVHHVLMVTQSHSIRGGICSLGLSCRFGLTRPLLTSHIFLGETLLSCLGFPIIVPNSPAVLDDSAAELPKHRFRSNDGDLPRPIGVWKDFLLDEIVLFWLSRYDLVKRSVLVEEKVRVPIA